MFKIYSSSAGSGKTYTLTKEYLKLALHPHNDSYYRHILAVTFTNAAAAEMKERILSMLKSFSNDEVPHPMLLDILRETFPDIAEGTETFEEMQQWLQLRARSVFQKILHGYSEFSVMTIDSFMSRLVSSFTDELGLPFGFETRLDNELLFEALDRVISKVGQRGNETLTQIIESYYQEHAQEGKGWSSLPKSIQNTAQNLLQEQGYLAMEQLQHMTIDDWVAIRKALQAYLYNTENKISELAQQGYSLITTRHLQASDFYQSNKGIYAYFEQRATSTSKHWEPANSYVRATIQDGKWNNSKKTAAATIKEIEEPLQALANQIEAYREQESPTILLFKSLIHQLYNLSLLSEIKKEQDKLLRANNQVHISEFNQKIIDIVTNDPVPFIFERLGEKYYHILIDEFQDTSKLQFANLLPLIDNALANGYFNLVVGDVKQAIYRFRGGDMDLLLRLSRKEAMQLQAFLGESNTFLTDRLYQLDHQSELARLTTNRRSYAAITAFNNDFFKSVLDTNELNLPLIKAVFDEHFQQEIGPTAPNGGHIQIDFIQNEQVDDATEEEDSESNPQIDRVTQLIEEVRKQGYHWRDIAVLCREKKHARALAEHFVSQHYPVISDDSLLLGNSKVVQLLINILKVIYTPDATQARLRAAELFLQITNTSITGGVIFEKIVHMSKEKSLASFLDFFAMHGFPIVGYRLPHLGIYEACEFLTSALGLYPLNKDLEYLFRFLDETHSYGNKRNNNLGEFLQWWERTGANISISIPDSTDAIRITTIHKSKGLEYPVVLIPYCEWSVAPKINSLLWIDLEHVDHPMLSAPTGNRLTTAVVPMRKELLETNIANQFEEETARTTLENLNLLYVAFTRPVQRLYIIASQPIIKDANKPLPQRVNYWIRLYLESKALWEEDKDTFILAEETGPCRHAHSKISQKPYVLGKIATQQLEPTLLLKRNAERIFDIETFEKKRDIFYKLRTVLSANASMNNLQNILTNFRNRGYLTSDDLPILEKNATLILTHPLIESLLDADRMELPADLIIPGGNLFQAHRVIQIAPKEISVIVFEIGKGKAADHIQKWQDAYTQAGFKKVNFILVDLIHLHVTPVQNSNLFG